MTETENNETEETPDAEAQAAAAHDAQRSDSG